MNDTQETPTPETVPNPVRALFVRVIEEQHPSLQTATIPVRFAEKKQSDPVKLKRVTAPEVREETGIDGVLVICPDWFGRHNPAQTRMGVDDPEADLYREMDIALMGVAANKEDDEGGLKIQHPEIDGLYKAEAMRYGVLPGTEAHEVVDVLIKRHEEGLNYGEALPSKSAPVEESQDTLPVDEDEPDGDSEGEVEVEPTEDEEEAPEPSSVEDTGRAVNPKDPWGAGNNLGGG